MPGLWDMHVHFGGGQELIEENNRISASGSTSPMGSPASVTRRRISAAPSWPGGPQDWQASAPNDLYRRSEAAKAYKPLWKGTIEVGTPAEVDAALDRLQSMKVDFVKITDNTLKPDILEYAVRAAKARGLKTSAHTPFALTIEQAAEAGLSSVEHLELFDQGRVAAGGIDWR